MQQESSQTSCRHAAGDLDAETAYRDLEAWKAEWAKRTRRWAEQRAGTEAGIVRIAGRPHLRLRRRRGA